MSIKNGSRADDRPPGGFAGIPRIVMEHPDYIRLSYKAKALLMDMAYQYKGKNNGDLTVAFTIMKKRGWRREATVIKAKDELIEANLILQTRAGRFSNPGARCALFAVTWYPIHECRGKDLDVNPTVTAPRKFSLEGKVIKMPDTQSVVGGYS